MNDKKLTIEELQTLRKLLNSLDENEEVFKYSQIMIEANEKVKIKKDKDFQKGDNK